MVYSMIKGLNSIDPDGDHLAAFISTLAAFRQDHDLAHDDPLEVRAPDHPITRTWAKPAELHHCTITYHEGYGTSYLIMKADSFIQGPDDTMLDLGIRRERTVNPIPRRSVHEDVTDAVGDLIMDELGIDNISIGAVDRASRTLVDYLAGRGLHIKRFDRTMQTRAAEWRSKAFPDGTVFGVTTKLAEECGEVARAIGGIVEGRSNRGDPVQESAQVVLVLLSLIGQYFPNYDLLDQVANELDRVGA